MRIQFNTGYVTNSSSTVHFFRKSEIEANPKAMAYVNMLGLDDSGYLGATHLCRGQGDAIIWADWAIQDAIDYDLEGYMGQTDAELTGGDVVAVLASDERETLAERFVSMMRNVGVFPFSQDERH